MKFFNTWLFAKNGTVGDVKAGPIDYFKFPKKVERFNVSNWADHCDKVKGNTLILGGGGLFHLPSLDYDNGRMAGLREMKQTAKHIIGWGLGSNIHGVDKVVYPDKCTEGFLALGIRDLPSDNWVPCVSCMDPAFDLLRKTTKPIVILEYPGINIPFPYPKMGAGDEDFKGVIKFLASGRVVVTNSYHGAYWGMLLGRKVIVYKPFSSRFFGIHPNVVILQDDSIPVLEESIDKAETDRKFLGKCRSANKTFFKEVSSIMVKL